MLRDALASMPQAFDAPILLRGQEYFQQGKVLNVRFSEGLIRGRVKGDAGQIHDVYMDLKSWPKKRAHCSCNAAINCRHVAACLFALREREGQQVHSPASGIRLDKRLDSWLKNLRAQEAAETKTPDITHHLLYLLELKHGGHEDKVILRLGLAKLLKRGGYGKPVPLLSITDSKKQYFRGDDDEIVAQLLFKCGTGQWFDALILRNSELLARVLNTGRAFLTTDLNKPLQFGPELSAECQWVLAPDGSQNLLLMEQDTEIAPLLLDQSWYLDLSHHTLGYVNTPYPIKQLAHLLHAPPISLEQASIFAQKLQQTNPDFPLPTIFNERTIEHIEPLPVLILDAEQVSAHDESLLLTAEEEFDAHFTAAVDFRYHDQQIPAQDSCEWVVTLMAGKLIQYERNRQYEEEQISILKKLLNLKSTSANHWILQDIRTGNDLEYVRDQFVPLLQAQGWQVELRHPLFQHVVQASEVEWFSELAEAENDFFSYQLGILIEGKPVSVVPLVADLLQRYPAAELEQLADEQLIKLPLQRGQALQINMGRIKPLVRLLLQFGARHISHEELLKIKKYQLILMQEAELALAATNSRWLGAESLRVQLKKLIEAQIPLVDPPQGLKAQLRDYQQYGLSWLQYLRQYSFSGILADDMGLGKTIQTLSHLQYEKEQGRIQKPSLIVAPTSLVGNWLMEAKRFTPDLRVLVYHGSERHQVDFINYDLIISTYGLIQRDKARFTEQGFYYLILDEAQFIKNARTKTTQIIQQLPAQHRLCLTGTPLENHLGELWSLFHFLMPGLLGDARQFRQWFRVPIEKNLDEQRREVLIKRISPFILRRTKNQVARELPPKTEMTHLIEISGPQRDLYEAIRMSMEKKVRDAIVKQGLGRSHIIILDALLKLRQICCDPRLLSLPEAQIAYGSSAKLDALMRLLDNLMEEGRRVLVFSQFTSMLSLIETALQERQYAYLKLTGQTQNRQSLVNQFQEGLAPIFLISLKAGGTGLNLTRADTVIHYDPWWNPAVENQATDRSHRIGQENPVFVYKLITEGTVEQVILGMQERKQHLVDGILSSEPGSQVRLNEEDLQQFFMPLD
ncbi:MAG: DEAD/DEAH box helicase [Legionella sp.]|nr:DEAD/DEAH box helicase [Legionella sp.]